MKGVHFMLTIPTKEASITDDQVFRAFNLNHPGMEEVKKAYEAGNLPDAKRQLLRYLETRKQPNFLFDYRSLPLAPIDTDTCPYSFQSSLGLSENLKEFCLYTANRMKDHVYVLPGGGRREVDLGKNWESMIHFNFLEDSGKRHRNPLDMIVRGQFFESLCVLYHETGDPEALKLFEEVLRVFLKTYPLDVVDTSPSVNRFQYTEDRDVMSVGWLTVVYTSLLYTRVPYEIDPDLAFEIIKRIWFLGIQFRRFDTDGYRPYNHHMWERGLVPFILGTMYPEIPDFVAMKEKGAATVRRHILEDFNQEGGYAEHSIAYWTGAALGEMLYRGIYLARLNNEPLLDQESKHRIDAAFHTISMICPPGARFPSLGDNGGPMIDPILTIGQRMVDHPECKKLLAVRSKSFEESSSLPLDFASDKAGFVCTRSGFGPKDNYLLMSAKVNCGYSGHNHMDMLSLFLTMRGEEIIGEPYVNTLYHRVRMNSEIRGYMYNMSSHNTVLAYGNPILPNSMYANKWGVLRSDTPITNTWSKPDGFYVSAYHDGYTICRHERELLFCRNRGVIISDHILRGNRLDSAHIQQWYLMDGTHTTLLSNDALLVEKNGVKLLFVWSGTEHQLKLDKADLLCPEMYDTPNVLPDRIKMFFNAPASQNSLNVTVTLNLLILDVTDSAALDLSPCTVSSLQKQLNDLSNRLNDPASLTQFPSV